MAVKGRTRISGWIDGLQCSLQRSDDLPLGDYRVDSFFGKNLSQVNLDDI